MGQFSEALEKRGLDLSIEGTYEERYKKHQAKTAETDQAERSLSDVELEGPEIQTAVPKK